VGKLSFDRYESQSPPEPDVIAWRGERTFGIEITNFHRRHEKRKESEEDRILEAALELYDRSNGPELLLHLMWAPHFTVRKKDRELLAEKIAALALRYFPAPRCWLTLDWRNFDHDLMTVIDNISMYGMFKGWRSLWSAARGRFVPEWDVAHLQNEINRKKGKPRRYRNPYKEIWLLIVSPFGAASSWMEMNDEVRNTQFVSSFHRTFLLSSFPLEVVELRSIQI
jgi:hypothetical protein